MAGYKVLEAKPNNCKTMSVREFHDLTGVGINRVYQLVHTQEFPAIRMGSKYYIIRSKVDEWLEHQVGKKL